MSSWTRNGFEPVTEADGAPRFRDHHNAPVAPTAPRLQLIAERRIGETIAAAVRVLAAEFASYLMVGFAYALLVRGALGLFADALPTMTDGETMQHYQDRVQHWAGGAWPVLIGITLVLPLVVSIVLAMVSEQAAGVSVSVRRAVFTTAPRIVPLVLTGACVTVLVSLGFVLILPGLFLIVLLGLAVPAAALEGLGPIAAIRRSSRLVWRRWWRTALALLTFVSAEIVGLIVPDAVISSIGDPTSGLGLVLSAAIDGVGFVFLMICVALLYGDNRARYERVTGAAPQPAEPEAIEAAPAEEEPEADVLSDRRDS